MQSGLSIIVFSHLRWDFVYQRPQHLLSRIASKHRVIFIEEPIFSNQPPHWQISQPSDNVAVCRPCTPSHTLGFDGDQIRYVKELLPDLMRRENLQEYVLWFYTPMALPIADELEPRAIIYDCMDELSAFLNAPPQLIGLEKELLANADLVFTGGPSLYRAKKDRHPHVHCFPSSVDVRHFASAADRVPEAQDQCGLAHPRLGYFGVIDERFDAALLSAVAEARPQWQIVIVGPIVKIDADTLPRNPNIHYFGQRSYAELPSYLTGWDLCIMPFARNQSTKFISPTKTLEYMAAEKTIVSTPITDVVEPYGDIVYSGGAPEEFIDACDRALNAGERDRAERLKKMRSVLARTSWDATATNMEDLIGRAITAKRPARPPVRMAGWLSWARVPPALARHTMWAKIRCWWSRTPAWAVGADR